MGNFQGQQAERDHLYGPPAVGQEERDVFITTGFPGEKERALKAAMFSCADKWIHTSWLTLGRSVGLRGGISHWFPLDKVQEMLIKLTISL